MVDPITPSTPPTPTPSITGTPTIDPVHEEDKVITGTAEAGSSVSITLPDGKTVTTTAGSDGKFSVEVPTGTELKEGDQVTGVAINAVAGSLPSDKASTTVIKKSEPEPAGDTDEDEDDTKTGGGKKNPKPNKGTEKTPIVTNTGGTPPIGDTEVPGITDTEDETEDEEDDIDEKDVEDDEKDPIDVVEPDDGDNGSNVGSGKEDWALTNLMASIATIFFAIFTVLSKRRKEEEGKVQIRHARYMIAGVVVAILSVILFVLTEDLSKPMAMTDEWTLKQIIPLVVEVGLTYLALKWRDEKPTSAK